MSLKHTSRAMCLSLALCALGIPTSQRAQANLIGSGNTVNTLFYLGSLGTPPEVADYGSPPVAGPASLSSGPVNFLEGAQSGATVDVGDTSITITNLLQLPFCTTVLPCADSFTGFEFLFTGSVNITSVSINPLSSTSFLPVANGLSLVSGTDIRVNVVGDAPNPGEELILDLSFGGTAPIPEPSPAGLLAFALFGLAVVRRTRAERLSLETA